MVFESQIFVFTRNDIRSRSNGKILEHLEVHWVDSWTIRIRIALGERKSNYHHSLKTFIGRCRVFLTFFLKILFIGLMSSFISDQHHIIIYLFTSSFLLLFFSLLFQFWSWWFSKFVFFLLWMYIVANSLASNMMACHYEWYPSFSFLFLFCAPLIATQETFPSTTTIVVTFPVCFIAILIITSPLSSLLRLYISYLFNR